MSSAEIPENSFQCAVCGGVFVKGWSDEESIASAIENGHRPTNDDDGHVCEDCYPELLFLAWFRAQQQIRPEAPRLAPTPPGR